jgi:tetratricopeptide (TPR) repeat protein
LQVVATRPDGVTEPLIAIDQFDENWHDSYSYRRPVRLPRGTRLNSTFVYDNTDANVRNRNRPARRVVYGSNANDEMADVYLQVTAVQADQRAVLMEHYKRYALQSQVAGFRKALEGHPGDPWSQEGLAACYVGLGEAGRAVTILEERLKSGPTAAFPLASLGLALLAAGDPVRAEARQRESIAIDREYALAWFGLGKALAAQKKAAEAEQAFQRAADLSPALWEARLNVADALMQRGELAKAHEVCHAAAADSPDVANVYLKLAEISARQKNWDASLAYCQTAQRLAPYTHPPKVVLAVFASGTGEPDRGLRLLREARAESPYHPVPPLMLGQLARRRQEVRPARDYLTAAASLPLPDNWPESHKQRFQVLLHSERFQLAQQMRDPGLARDALSQWLKAEPGNARVRAMYEQLPAGR